MALNYGTAFNNDNSFAYREWLYSDSQLAVPVINLVGSGVTVILNGSYVDPGYTATDDNDGDITGSVVVTGTVDTSTVGIYTLRYNVTNSIGNDAVEVIRLVTVAVVPIKRVVQWDEQQTPDLVCGDNFMNSVTLYSGVTPAVFDLSQADTVKAAIVSIDHSKRLTDVVELSSGGAGSDWANGIVAIDMPESVTADAASGLYKSELAKIEIEVNLVGNSFTWFGTINLIPGYID